MTINGETTSNREHREIFMIKLVYSYLFSQLTNCLLHNPDEEVDDFCSADKREPSQKSHGATNCRQHVYKLCSSVLHGIVEISDFITIFPTHYFCLQSRPGDPYVVHQFGCSNVEKLLNWVTEWPNDQMTKWPRASDQVTKWLSDRLTDWPTDQVTGSFVDNWPYDIFSSENMYLANFVHWRAKERYLHKLQVVGQFKI